MTDASLVPAADLRKEFSAELSSMYAREVPLYGELMAAVKRVNLDVIRERPDLGLSPEDVDHVTAERHGAIRLGRDDEMAWMARFFAVLGMHPVDVYDLSAAGAKAQPVIATAFRPVALDEIEASPFRVFCSLLRVDDERFFDDADLRRRMHEALDRREIFTPRLREVIETAEAQGGLDHAQERIFLDEGLRLFRWSGRARERGLYQELRARGTNIAADICCFPNPHLNHLTPNTLDIDALQQHMARVLATDHAHLRAEMKDHIEGPPRRRVPVLLRQTSYKALVETVRFDDQIEGTHTARFGEIEQRGLALTPAGRRVYDEALARIEALRADGATPTDADFETAFASLPDDPVALRRDGLGHFVYEVADAAAGADRALALDDLVERGVVRARPIRYEDFLPISAAGIFASNLRQAGARQPGESPHSRQELEAVLGRPVVDPRATYAAQEARSILDVFDILALPLEAERRRELESIASG